MKMLEKRLNKIAQNQTNNEIESANDTVYIALDKIKPSKKNNFPIVKIVEMAESLRERGLDHNIVVRPIENGMYEIISGERRYRGHLYNHEHGYEGFDKIRCVIRVLDDINAEIGLELANYETRGNITEGKKLESVENLTRLYREKMKNDKTFKIEGKLRDYVGKKVGLSGAMVGFYQQISNNLIPELKNKVYQDEITIEAALEICRLYEAVQREIYNQVAECTQLTIKDIQNYLPSKKTTEITEEVNETAIADTASIEVAEKVEELEESILLEPAQDDRFDFDKYEQDTEEEEEDLDVQELINQEPLVKEIRLLPKEALVQQQHVTNELKKLKYIATEAGSFELIFMIDDFNTALKEFITKNIVE